MHQCHASILTVAVLMSACAPPTRDDDQSTTLSALGAIGREAGPAHLVARKRGQYPTLEQVLPLGRDQAPNAIDELGAEGAAALRRLATSAEALNFAHKPTAEDWAQVLRAAQRNISPGGRWEPSVDLKTVVNNVKVEVVAGLSERQAGLPPYRSPLFQARFDDFMRRLGSREYSSRIDRELRDICDATGVWSKLTAEQKPIAQQVALSSRLYDFANYSPEEAKILASYYLAGPERDTPRIQALLELSYNKDFELMKVVVRDIDFPAAFSPSSLNQLNPLPLQPSSHPIPTMSDNFVLSNQYPFSADQLNTVTQAAVFLAQNDPNTWNLISLLAANVQPIEIRNNEGKGSHVDFDLNGRPVMLIDFSQSQNVMFKFLDGQVGTIPPRGIVWHEMQHLGQLFEYNIRSSSDIDKALGGNSSSMTLQFAFENEATTRTNSLHAAAGIPLRADYTQTVSSIDYLENGKFDQTNYQEAIQNLNRTPAIYSGLGTNIYGNMVGAQVLYADGYSSLIVLPSVLNSFDSPSLNGVLTIDPAIIVRARSRSAVGPQASADLEAQCREMLRVGHP